MLFKASITPKVLQSEDALVEQLYIFLNAYVPSRLKFESRDEIEDCLQETIMYMLKRYHSLNKADIAKINIEAFFYNRANSFVSSYLRKLKNYRKAKDKYISMEVYKLEIENMQDSFIELIDIATLHKIVLSYSLKGNMAEDLYTISLARLGDLGYNAPEVDLDGIASDKREILDALSFAVVDEYMIKSAEAFKEGEEGIDG